LPKAKIPDNVLKDEAMGQKVAFAQYYGEPKVAFVKTTATKGGKMTNLALRISLFLTRHSFLASCVYMLSLIGTITVCQYLYTPIKIFMALNTIMIYIVLFIIVAIVLYFFGGTIFEKTKGLIGGKFKRAPKVVEEKEKNSKSESIN